TTLVTIVARVGLGDRGGKQQERRGGTGGKGLHRAPIQQEPFRFANKKVQAAHAARTARKKTAVPDRDGGESCARTEKDQRLENWNRLRAPG
ncbi:MAG: hypothetical protein RLZZ447_1915, partial [Verrucomicrobiota bacterium]